MSYRGTRQAGRLGDVSLVASAVLTPVIGQLQAALSDMTTRWSPSGFYTPDQVAKIGNALIAAQKLVIAPIEGYLASNTAAVADWTTKIVLDGAQKALTGFVPIARAAAQAKAAGVEYLDAPGLKTQVITSYTKLLMAVRGFRGIERFDSWVVDFADMVVSIGKAMMLAHDVATAVLGVAKKAVQAAVAAGAAVLTVPDTLATIFEIGKWVALGLGGVWLWKNKDQLGAKVKGLLP